MQEKYNNNTNKTQCLRCKKEAHVIENNIFYCATCMLDIQKRRDGYYEKRTRRILLGRKK